MKDLRAHDGESPVLPDLRPCSPSTGRLGYRGTARSRRFLVEFCLSAWVIALLTFCAFVLHLELSTAGFLYLLTVVIVAQTCGFRQATLTSLIGVACLDFFIVPPIFSFDFGGPQNMIALATFEFCALIVSRLSAREKRHALEARNRRRSMEKLFEVSRGTLQLDLHAPPGPQIAELIRSHFLLECVALYDERLGRADATGACSAKEQDLVRTAFIEALDSDDHHGKAAGVSHRVLRVGHRLTGALYLRGIVDPLTADALASLTAVVLERCRSFEKETQAEAARQTEQTRTAVLDALAHAFKTPLTAILTASAGLLEIGDLSESQLDLASLVEEQSEQLNDLATRLLQTARLDFAALRPPSEQVMVSGLIREVLSEQGRKLDQHRVEVSIADSTLAAEGDRGLLATIVSQFVDNAAKYSAPGTPIRVSAEGRHSQIVISVHNEGIPIRLENRERIFERFYRCPETKDIAPGTGIGLSIARQAAEAHHGHVWVISGEGKGNTFFVSLPQSQFSTCAGEPADESLTTARRVG